MMIGIQLKFQSFLLGKHRAILNYSGLRCTLFPRLESNQFGENVRVKFLNDSTSINFSHKKKTSNVISPTPTSFNLSQFIESSCQELIIQFSVGASWKQTMGPCRLWRMQDPPKILHCCFMCNRELRQETVREKQNFLIGFLWLNVE